MPKYRLSFGEDLFFFFFWRTPSFGLEQPFQFQGRPFFFFFLENTLIWAEKTVSILTEKRNASSHFSGKSLLPPQIILSSYGHVHIGSGIKSEDQFLYANVQLISVPPHFQRVLPHYVCSGDGTDFTYVSFYY